MREKWADGIFGRKSVRRLVQEVERGVYARFRAAVSRDEFRRYCLDELTEVIVAKGGVERCWQRSRQRTELCVVWPK